MHVHVLHQGPGNTFRKIDLDECIATNTCFTNNHNYIIYDLLFEWWGSRPCPRIVWPEAYTMPRAALREHTTMKAEEHSSLKPYQVLSTFPLLLRLCSRFVAAIDDRCKTAWCNAWDRVSSFDLLFNIVTLRRSKHNFVTPLTSPKNCHAWSIWCI